jgi:hypothetical protein
MALLNPPDILPEAMRFIVRAILGLAGDGANREELLSIVAPTGLIEALDAMGKDAESLPGDESDLRSGGQRIADASLGALRTLGIVKTSGDRVQLDNVPAAWKKPTDVTAAQFSAHLLDRVLVIADPQATVGDAHGVMDLVHSLVVLYAASDPLWPFERFETASSSPQSRSFLEQFRNHFGDIRTDWPFPNAEQWLTFRRWAPYVALARTFGSTGLIPDASSALAQRLSDLPAGRYEVGEFVSHCARAIPFLDGGALHFGHETHDSAGQSVVSPGLSVSLLQLHAQHVLSFVRLSDTGTRTITVVANGSADQIVSHVDWKTTAAKKRAEK